MRPGSSAIQSCSRPDAATRLGGSNGTRINTSIEPDIGVFAAISFDQPKQFLGQCIEIAGDSLDGPEIAQVFSQVSGLPAQFQQMPIEQLRAFDAEVAKMFEWLDQHPADGPDLAVLREVHPGLMTLATWLRETAWKPETPGVTTD